MRPWTRLGLTLALLSLTLGCQGVSKRIHLPDPGLPACIVEEPKAPGEAVGRFEFAQPWVDSLQAMISQGRATQAAQEAIKCASETAHRLRQATTAIRLNNQPD